MPPSSLVIAGTVAYFSNLTNTSVKTTGGSMDMTVIVSAVYVNAARVIAQSSYPQRGRTHYRPQPHTYRQPDPPSDHVVVQFKLITDQRDVPCNSGVPTATKAPLSTNDDAAIGYTAPASDNAVSAFVEKRSTRISGKRDINLNVISIALLFGLALKTYTRVKVLLKERRLEDILSASVQSKLGGYCLPPERRHR